MKGVLCKCSSIVSVLILACHILELLCMLSISWPCQLHTK